MASRGKVSLASMYGSSGSEKKEKVRKLSKPDLFKLLINLLKLDGTKVSDIEKEVDQLGDGDLYDLKNTLTKMSSDRDVLDSMIVRVGIKSDDGTEESKRKIMLNKIKFLRNFIDMVNDKEDNDGGY